MGSRLLKLVVGFPLLKFVRTAKRTLGRNRFISESGLVKIAKLTMTETSMPV
jgi:hypothetical protein